MKCDKEFFNSLFSQFAMHKVSNINFSFSMRQYLIKADGSSNCKRQVVCVKDLIDKDLTEADVVFFPRRQTCVPAKKIEKKLSCAMHRELLFVDPGFNKLATQANARGQHKQEQ